MNPEDYAKGHSDALNAVVEYLIEAADIYERVGGTHTGESVAKHMRDTARMVKSTDAQCLAVLDAMKAGE